MMNEWEGAVRGEPLIKIRKCLVQNRPTSDVCISKKRPGNERGVWCELPHFRCKKRVDKAFLKTKRVLITAESAQPIAKIKRQLLGLPNL